jgi:crossover junction endodeoxyribonuclease RusA
LFAVVSFSLPWPPVQLNPNTRLHWAALAKFKARYRLACRLAVEEQQAALATKFRDSIPAGPLLLVVRFMRPNRRSYDRDNLLARMKSGIDGACDALGLNDKRFTTVVIRVADEVGGRVDLTIRADDQEAN